MKESDIDVCIEQVQIEIEQHIPIRRRQAKLLLDEIYLLRAELVKAENTRIGLIGQIEGARSAGPFTAEGCVILCEDVGVMLSLSHDNAASAIAEKLNQMQAEITRLRKAIESHRAEFARIAERDKNGNPMFDADDVALYSALNAPLEEK